MSLAADITALKSHLLDFQTIEQMRAYLNEHNLKLVAIFIPDGTSCLEWDITQKQVCKFLDVRLKVKISNENELIETTKPELIRVKEPDWTDPDHLFETLKQGIAKSIEKLKREVS